MNSSSRRQKILVTCSSAPSLRNFRGRLIEQMRSAGHEVVAVAPEFAPDMEEWCRARGVQMDLTRLNNQSLNPLGDLAGLSGLYSVIRRHRPDVVMGYTHKPALYTAFAAKAAGVPRITMMVTGMGFGFAPGPGLKRKLVPAITKTLFALGCAVSDKVIFHNQDNYRFFLDHKLLRNPNKGVVVGGSGVDLSHFTRSPLPPGGTEELTFLLVARIVRYKGILEFAEAAKALKRRYPKARFVLAGYRDNNPLAYTDAEWAFIQRQLEYLGPFEDVRSLYDQAHVYVLPSYGEGMPRTVLEAMAAGRPIITTDTFGCRDTVEEGVNGFLVPTHDAGAIATAMEEFLSGRAAVAKMGEQSYARVKRLFDVESVNRDTLEALLPTEKAA